MSITTPLPWLAEFTANLVTGGSQSDPQIVGLSNGNFLVAWEDDNATTGPGTGVDLVGVIFDPLGNPITDSLYLNSGYINDRNDTNPSIAATDDGGFVMAWDYRTGSQDTILYGRFGDDGLRDGAGLFVVNDQAGTTAVQTDPQIAFRPDGSVVVVYEKRDGNTNQIVAKVLPSSGGGFGSEIVLRNDFGASGGADGDPVNPTMTVLEDGRIVVAFQEIDVSSYGIETAILNANNTIGVGVNVSSSNGDFEPTVAALTDGGWVVAWSSGGDIFVRLYNSDGSPQTGELAVATNSDNKNEVQVIGLKDGGFFLAWDDDTQGRMEGRRFDSDGSSVGQVINLGGSAPTLPDLALSADGRILVAWDDAEISASIFDPRGNVIRIDDGATAVARKIGGTIIGSAADDVFIGQGSADKLVGKGGDDFLRGGGANDSILGGGGFDVVSGQKGNDFLNAGGGNDIGLGGRGADLMRGGKGEDELFGEIGRDTLNGQAGNDTLFGGTGNDRVLGGGGNDILNGDAGQDVLAGNAGRDVLFGGLAADVFDFNRATDSLKGVFNRDVIRDFNHGVDKIDLSTIDADTTLAGNQAFEFIGSAGFSDAGQIRGVVKGGDIILKMDRNGDGIADMEIVVKSPGLIDTDDFIL